VFFFILILALGILALVTWNVSAWPQIPKKRSGQAESRALLPSVAILIPARNEAHNLPACLAAAQQQGEIVREILVYDDHSRDATAQIVQSYAQVDDRVRLVPTSMLTAGWCGKNFACARLAASAQADWLLFLDADARLADDAAARMVEEALRRRVTLLSCWPGLALVNFWERALMPMLNFCVFSLFPAPLSLVNNHPSLGLAHGACLLMQRESYEAVGGHSAVHNEIFEDTRLAQLWRARGHRGLCLDGQSLVTVRMYDSLGTIWRGFQKNFFPAFRRETSFWAFLSLHATIFLLPFLLVGWSLKAALAASCVLLMRALLAVRFGHPWWSILLHPLSEAILLALALSSWWRCKSGKGVTWKGRIYQAHQAHQAEQSEQAEQASQA
jgi:glycosyltransferase involved in cell wall biosynthesis